MTDHELPIVCLACFRRPIPYRAMVKVTTNTDVFGVVVLDDYTVGAAPERYRRAEGLGVRELRRQLGRTFVTWEKLEPPE